MSGQASDHQNISILSSGDLTDSRKDKSENLPSHVQIKQKAVEEEENDREPALKRQKLQNGESRESKSCELDKDKTAKASNLITPVSGRIKRVKAKRTFTKFLAKLESVKRARLNPDNPDSARSKKVTLVLPPQDASQTCSRKGVNEINNENTNREGRRSSKRKRTKARKFENEMTIAPIEANDVLLGGARAEKSKGTKRFRRLVQENLHDFNVASWCVISIARCRYERIHFPF